VEELNSLLKRFGKLPDLHQNSFFVRVMQESGWKVLGRPESCIFLKKMGVVSVVKVQRPDKIDLNEINKIRRSNHAIFTYIEPSWSQNKVEKVGIKVEPIANSATSLVDLTLSKDELLKSFKSKMRYNIGHCLRKNEVKIITKKFSELTKDDIKTFEESKKSWNRRKRLYCYEDKFLEILFRDFGKSGWIHLAYYQNKCVGSLMILKNGEVAIYYAAFAEKIGNSLFAPTLLTWTAMMVAKENGCTIFDFGGIYDPRYRMYRKWKGFTKFKEGFNPTPIYYPTTRLLLGW
jgi:hypothetical protein